MTPTAPTPSNPLRIGVLGAANIARQFIRDVAGSAHVRIVAVASRDAERATAFADAFSIGRRHASYEALLEDREVDAVYVPLPNTLHAPWCVRAAAHGKHVLCEKPLTLTLAEAREIFAAARRAGVMLLESYPYWFQPQTAAMMALVEGREGAGIGEVRHMQTSFGFTLGSPETNIRMKPDLGGGALLDAGSYPLSLIRLVMGRAPVAVRADATMTDTGVDISTLATLYYADGRRAQMSCAMDGANHRRAVIVGAEGTIETEYLNHTSDLAPDPFGYQDSQLRFRHGTAANRPFETVRSPTGSGFRFAAEAFARMVAARDTAMMDRYAAISLDIAATIEAIARSAQSGEKVFLADI